MQDWQASVAQLVQNAMAEKQLSGCVIGFGSGRGLQWSQAYGLSRVEPNEVPMTTDTIFDLASLTKPIATATSVVQCIEKGDIQLDHPVADYLPEFGKNGKEPITVRQLLIHTSGLIPDNPLSDYAQGPEHAWQKICELKPQNAPGEAFKYSDVNFIVLGKLIEQVSGQSFDQFVQEHTLKPLGMHESGFGVAQDQLDRCAPTERRNGEWIVGQVHDPRAHALGGVAGHAGLFSTLKDLSRYAEACLNQGVHRSPDQQAGNWMQPESIQLMTAPNQVPGGVRGLGWDIQSPYSSNRGDRMSARAFGHGGFTGTVLWIDPELDFYFIFLSSRLHPTGKGSVNKLAGQIANVLVSAANEIKQHGASRPAVRLGIDVLQATGFEPLQGKRVGLITNHTGVDSTGRSTVEILSEAPEVTLAAIFSPEHGFFGNLDEARIADGVDRKTGLRIFSLYGQTKRPTAQMLEGIDVLVFDIQDIGTRFYTYISTMGEAMSAAAEHGCSFVVLDRPNPINGIDVYGPMLDPGIESFVGYHTLPIRHGMTVGELAGMLRDERKWELELTVVPCQHWNRSEYWDSTGLTWINPSPNMRSLRQAFLYPGIGILETTNVSVGRGTDTPFEWIGSPWIDGMRLAQELNHYRLPGVSFVPRTMIPSNSKFAGATCHGVEVIVTDRSRCNPVHVGLAIAISLRRLHPEEWDTRSLPRLLGNQAVFDAIVADDLTVAEDSRVHAGVQEFLTRRARYLLYP
jgi:uncharacterized protein YbbC (DUF1343 family)